MPQHTQFTKEKQEETVMLKTGIIVDFARNPAGKGRSVNRRERRGRDKAKIFFVCVELN
jgi:hypothetical protein